ncbi:MAG: aminomethyl-transferring glycine dehydrogenase, partial [Bacteroidia bacterium]
MHISDPFQPRHIGPDAAETEHMLQTIGVNSLDELIEQTVPGSIRRKGPMNLPAALSESEMLEQLRYLASQNKVYKNFIGLGYYGTITPGVILRNI